VSDLRLGRWQDVLADDPADGSVRLILTSPPYDNARTYEGTQTEPVDFGELARFALRVLMPGGTLAMVLDAPMRDGEQSVTPYRVICEWAALPGWKFRQFLAYGRAGAPGNTTGWFRRDHEPLIVFVRDGGEQVCEKSRIAEHSASYKISGYRRRFGGDSTAGTEARKNLTSDIRHRGSIWWYGNVGGDDSTTTGHPATFAERFALDAVQVWSNPGDLVLDPYAGSATVGRACIDLGRSFVGAERVPKYHAIGIERLRQTSIFDRIAPREEAQAAE